MDRLILTLIPLPFGIFWAWMFSDMMKNDNLPQCYITFTSGSDSKRDWTLAFIFLNIFTAILYYSTVYGNRH
jgi:hypothetical protein